MRIDVRTPDGVADCYAYRPEGGKDLPAVLMFMDALGMRPAIQQMAQELADAGYFVLAPNLFHRHGDFPPFDQKNVWSDPAERERLMKMIHSLDNASAMADVKAYLDAIAQQPEVKQGPVGCIGYCMGGRLAFLSAATYPDRIGAAACFHAGGLVTDAPDSPHTLADRIKARLYLGVADNDRSATPEQQQTLKSALDAAGVRYQLELYAGKAHGFAVKDSHVHDADAEARHWERAKALFGDTIGRGG